MNILTRRVFFDRILHKMNLTVWRVVRVVEGAALEMLCTKVPRVRIPNSPPKAVGKRKTLADILFCRFYAPAIHTQSPARAAAPTILNAPALVPMNGINSPNSTSFIFDGTSLSFHRARLT